MEFKRIFDEELGVRKIQADALIINYNKLGLAELHAQNLQRSEELLIKAESILKFATQTSYLLLKSMTLTNLANLYIQSNNHEKALDCLSEIANSEFPGAKTNLAISYINIAGIKSLQNDHENSLQYLLSAITMLKDSVQMTQNILNSLIISLHNCALEYSFLGHKKETHKYMREA